ncbi:MAG: topoisomerase DNA-binding C4 zinc finger domain-containing protein, partial [Victivallales bacterium]|nr:topoisomerase DNA-binding C4 zinc finger domain-containing protein [Victivallales bacterium]
AAKYAAKIDGYADLAVALGGTPSTEHVASEPAETAAVSPAVDVAEAAAKQQPASQTAVPSEEEQARLRDLLGMVDEVTKWRAPSGRGGKRVFDDQEFAESLKRQFSQKGSLSDRQVAALKKMLAKYSSQIKNYEERAKADGIGTAAQPPVQLEERCPDCGAPLVQRMGRGRPFIGCSAFPKCRYIKPREK